MTRRALVAIAAPLVLIGALVVGAGSAAPQNAAKQALTLAPGEYTLSPGGDYTFRCPTLGENWTSANNFPLRDHCPPGVAPTTTTTRAVTTTTGPISTTTTTPVVPGSTPAAYMPQSIFNQPVAGDSVLSNSSAIVANIVAQYHAAYGQVGVNFNRPVYEASASTPDVSVSVSPGCNNFTVDTGTQNPDPVQCDGRRELGRNPQRLPALDEQSLGVLAGAKDREWMVGVLGRGSHLVHHGRGVP